MESKQQTCSFYSWEVGAWREAPLQPGPWFLSPDSRCQGQTPRLPLLHLCRDACQTLPGAGDAARQDTVPPSLSFCPPGGQ